MTKRVRAVVEVRVGLHNLVIGLLMYAISTFSVSSSFHYLDYFVHDIAETIGLSK